jgi:hypothetical protein
MKMQKLQIVFERKKNSPGYFCPILPHGLAAADQSAWALIIEGTWSPPPTTKLAIKGQAEGADQPFYPVA